MKTVLNQVELGAELICKVALRPGDSCGPDTSWSFFSLWIKDDDFGEEGQVAGGHDEHCQWKWSLLVILAFCEVPERVQLIFSCWIIGELIRINSYILRLDHLFSAVLHAGESYSTALLLFHPGGGLGPVWILKSTTPGMKDSGTGPSSANTLPSTGPCSVYLCSRFVCNTMTFSWKRGESGSIWHRLLVVFIYWSLLCGREDFLILITQTYHLE